MLDHTPIGQRAEGLGVREVVEEVMGVQSRTPLPSPQSSVEIEAHLVIAWEGRAAPELR